jgi:hypothetical protein
MAKFRKKPVVIEAFEFNGDAISVIEWANNVSEGNGTFLRAKSPEKSGDHPILEVHTLEGVMTASLGDMVICGVNGEFYFCKPDIFHKTYEAVNE